MKNFKILILALFASLVFISCGNDNATNSTPDYNYSLSTSLIDFGYSLNSIAIKINVESGKLNWRAYSKNSNRWFEYDLPEGDTTKTLNISILRSKLSFGKNIDTLYFVASIPKSSFDLKGNQKQSKDSIRTLILTAYKNPFVLEALTSQMQNQILILQPYFDSTYSFIGTYNLDINGTKTSYGVASFCNTNKLFADAGNSFTIQSYNNSSTLSSNSIQKKSFIFNLDSNKTINANYYLTLIPNDKIQFDNLSMHRFSIAGGSEYITPFSSEILSVTPIVCVPAPSTLSISTGAMSIFWNKTDAPDDSVYAEVISVSDNHFVATASKPVNDDNGAIKITASALARVKTGNSQVYVWIIRFRNIVDNVNKRIYVCQSQKRYEVVLN